MEDNLNFKVNGRRPTLFVEWQMTSIYWQLEDNLHFGKWKTTLILCCFKWKTTTVSSKVKLAQASPELGTAQPQLVIDFLDELGLYKQYIQFSSSPPPISRKNNYIIASIPITF